MEDLEIGDYMYFARVLRSVDVYEMIPLKIRTVNHDDGWFVGLDSKTKAAYLFQERDIGQNVFFNIEEAQSMVKQAKKHRKEVH